MREHCVTRILQPLSERKTRVYVTSHLIHSQHGGGALIVSSRKTGAVIASRNWWSEELRVESVERGAQGDAGVKPVKRESEAVGQ